MIVQEATSREASKGDPRTKAAHSYNLSSYTTAEKVRKRLGLDAKSMAIYLGIDEKTYYRRAKSSNLRGGESLKIQMLTSILQEATRVLHGEDEATHWIITPIISLDHKRPLDLLTSINGYERVKNTLTMIEYGMY